MEPEGPRASANPRAVLASLASKRKKLQEELRSVEKQVYELETSYLQDASHFVNALKGFDGFLSLSKSSSLKRSRKFQPDDRLFSLSSVTSPAVEEQKVGRDEFGQVCPKGAGILASGQGKPKRGRLAAREAKRTKSSSEQNVGDQDKPSVSSR